MSNAFAHPRVLLAANGSATWAGIRIALSEAAIEVCGEVEHSLALASEASRLEPNVCLVDVALPGGVLRSVAALVERRPRVAVIVLTPQVNHDDFLAAMNAGAVGYLPMSISPQRLPAVVHAVLLGELAVPRYLMPVLLDELRARGSRRRLVLLEHGGVDFTVREAEVLELLQDNLSTREIADRLQISEVTVRRHLSTALKKLNVQTRREALKLLQNA
jgi:two-component system, NarL family, response regulator LiaR